MTELVLGCPERPQLTAGGITLDEVDTRGKEEGVRRLPKERWHRTPRITGSGSYDECRDFEN
jgi:hypothetical protein